MCVCVCVCVYLFMLHCVDQARAEGGAVGA